MSVYIDNVAVSGIFRSARYGRVLRSRCRRSQNAVGSVRRGPKQKGFGRPIGRRPLRSSAVRRRPVRSGFPICRRSIRRRRPVPSGFPIRRRPLRGRFSVRLPVRLFLHRLSIRSQDLGFPVRLLSVNVTQLPREIRYQNDRC